MVTRACRIVTLCAQLTRGLLAIAKFIVINNQLLESLFIRSKTAEQRTIIHCVSKKRPNFDTSD